MTAYRLASDLRDWLGREELLDSEVSLEEVRFHHGGPVSLYLRLVRKRAITFGDHVYFRDRGLTEQGVPANWPLYAHELVHVAQYRRAGASKFLAVYSRDMLKAGLRYSRRLALEAPAYERQRLAEERLGLR
jgi:hypothetical protein